MLLAIAKPDIKAVLIEPRAKRVAFLNFVKSALKLQNVEILQSRVEDLEFQKYDLITSRAVSNTSLLLELTSNISADNTAYLFYKGSLCQTEIQDAKLKNYEIEKVGEHRNYLYIKRKDLINGN
jgi:16S rRNA (guanine527-N7)-methyltransferase